MAANPDVQDSFNCNIAIADEIHAFKKPKQYTLFKEAMKAYRNKLMIGISTAGDDPNGFLAQQVEYGPTEEILKNPLHPYTQDMILAIPENGMKVSMTGFAPPHTDYQNYGCRYKHRCRFAHQNAIQCRRCLHLAIER